MIYRIGISVIIFFVHILAPLPFLSAKNVIAYGDYYRPGTYPLICCNLWIVIINTAIGWIPTIESVLRGTSTFVVCAEVYLPVRYRGKCTRLINNATDGVGKAARLYPV